jgi:hypothetical protein
MLEELQTLALVGLLVSTYYLTVGCRNISESMPLESTNITEKVTGVTEVLDDIADLLNEALESFTNSAITQTPSSPVQSILSALISSATTPKEHGSLTQEWQVHQNDSPPTLETENQPNELSS